MEQCYISASRLQALLFFKMRGRGGERNPAPIPPACVLGKEHLWARRSSKWRWVGKEGGAAFSQSELGISSGGTQEGRVRSYARPRKNSFPRRSYPARNFHRGSIPPLGYAAREGEGGDTQVTSPADCFGQEMLPCCPPP